MHKRQIWRTKHVDETERRDFEGLRRQAKKEHTKSHQRQRDVLFWVVFVRSQQLELVWPYELRCLVFHELFMFSDFFACGVLLFLFLCFFSMPLLCCLRWCGSCSQGAAPELSRACGVGPRRRSSRLGRGSQTLLRRQGWWEERVKRRWRKVKMSVRFVIVFFDLVVDMFEDVCRDLFETSSVTAVVTSNNRSCLVGWF